MHGAPAIRQRVTGPTSGLRLVDAGHALPPDRPHLLGRGAALRLRGGFDPFACFGRGLEDEEPVVDLWSDELLSVEVSGEVKPGETRARRNAHFPDLLTLPFSAMPEVDTPFAAFSKAAERFGSRRCLGARVAGADGGFGEYSWKTYLEVAEEVGQIGAGLRRLCDVNRGTLVGIFAGNRPEWTTAVLGTWSVSAVAVPLWDSASTQDLAHMLKHSAAPVVLCERRNLHTLLAAARGAKTVATVVLLERELSKDDRDHLQIFTGGKAAALRMLALGELLEAGASAAPHPRDTAKGAAAAPHRPDDVAAVLYTSGTSGGSKGVVLSARNLLASLAGCLNIDPTFDGSDPTTSHFFHRATYLSHLPPAHSLELALQLILLACGSEIGFASGAVRRLTEDIRLLRPTIFPGVPRLLTQLHAKVREAVAARSPLLAALLDRAVAASAASAARRRAPPRWAAYVVRRWVRAPDLLGGRVRLFVSGAAPLHPATHTFFRVAFDAPISQGYGLTENGGPAVALAPDAVWHVGSVGAPLPCTEVKLVDVPALGYVTNASFPSASAVAHQAEGALFGPLDPALAGRPGPRGEICLRGPNVMMRYLNDDGATAAAVDAAGWLHTGDIGEWNPDGTLTVLDRADNMVRLGPRRALVSLERVEEVMQCSRFVTQCWAHAAPGGAFLVAVIVPDHAAVAALCEQVGDVPAGASLRAACAHASVQTHIQQDILECARARGLEAHEFPRGIYVESGVLLDAAAPEGGPPLAFSVENGCLTPSLKLRRRALLARYRQQVDAFYERLS